MVYIRNLTSIQVLPSLVIYYPWPFSSYREYKTHPPQFYYAFMAHKLDIELPNEGSDEDLNVSLHDY
jgi:hypothetical protein